MLSQKEQNKIIQVLGYGGKKLQAGSVIYDKIMNDRLANLPSETEDLVRGYLAQIYAIETRIFQAPARMSAEAVGDIRMNLHELQMLRAERKKIAKEISVHLDIPYVGNSGTNVGVVL